MIYESWNTPRGCTQEQRDYPQVAEHRRSFLVKGGPCPERDHNAITHAKWVADKRRNPSRMTHTRSKKSFR